MADSRFAAGIEGEEIIFEDVSNELFFELVKEGDLPAIEGLYNSGMFNVNATNSSGTLLKAAVKDGNKRVVEFLLKKGAVDKNDAYYDLLSSRMNFYSHSDIMRLLIESGLELNPLSSRLTPLIQTIYRCFDPVAEWLVKLGADVNLCNIQGIGPLHAAVEMGSAKLVQFLLESGADVNRVSNLGLSIIDIAGVRTNPEIIKLLLQYNCVIPIQYADDKFHARYLVISKMQAEVRAELEMKKASLNVINAGLKDRSCRFFEVPRDLFEYIITPMVLDHRNKRQ